MGRRWRFVHGHTHSRNARAADEAGEMPLTRAVEAVYVSLDCKKHKVTRIKVREFLKANCYRGWHHVAGPSRVREIAYYATNLTDAQRSELLGPIRNLVSASRNG